MRPPAAITKELSANDTGETGGHQAGILIPKEPEILAFFPSLDGSVKNPRHELQVTDPTGQKRTLAFIYYNNRLFGGTRNEYRLTRLTEFFRSHNLKSGDVLILRREEGRYSVEFERKKKSEFESGRLQLGSTWKIVSI